ncbi:MAG: HD domain-containing protein [Acidobacteriaceae bacterium]|nr:HD domain-containing protein [Acidobacteriaceae bacterium]
MREPQSLLKLFEATREAAAVFEARSAWVDNQISGAARDYLARISAPFALVAVGGYGRQELFPYSDLDIGLVFENETELADIKEPLCDFLRVLWDSGLKMSQSVRTIAECCRLNEQNIELHISLLDLRYLCGDRAVFGKLADRLQEFKTKNGGVLTRHLTSMCRQRHGKFQNTPYHLEPNVKETPGGIRDIHVLHWLTLLGPEKEQYRESLAESARAKEFLSQIRCFLHFEAHRDNNLLTFESQDNAAEQLPAEPVDPEEWMRLYYRHARAVFAGTRRALEFAEWQESGSLLRLFRDSRQRLSTADLTVSHDRVFLKNPATIMSSAASVFGVFSFVARHGIALSWDAERRLRASAQQLAAMFQARPPEWPLWRELFSLPHAATALHEMQETGVLAAAIPEWEAIDSLVVRDFYHRYTVDEHTLVAIEAIDKLATNDAGTPPRLRELAREDDDLAVVRFALLLHDIGKGTRPGDHVRGSHETASELLLRLKVPDAEAKAILFLIDHHLDLSGVMNGRDLGDPATARFITSRVGTQEDLRRLTLLTYADISGVNPSAMTPWRAEQLWRVYTIGSEQLTRELTGDRIHPSPESPVLAFAGPELRRFLDGLPTRYLRTHSREEIEHHFALEQNRQRDGVAVEVSKGEGAYTAVVLAPDQRGLFASICGALASFGMNILAAEAYANTQGCALDVFQFSDPMRTLELNPGEAARLEWTIACVVKGAVEVGDLLKRRRLAKAGGGRSRITPSVRFNNQASDSSTLIHFIGEDRPGLLYALTSTLAHTGCNIELVLADTEGKKAIDVFYVTEEGKKLDEAAQQQMHAALAAAGRHPF